MKLLVPFIVQYLKKSLILITDLKIWAYQFWAQNGAFDLKKNVFGKTINVTFMYIPLGGFHFAKLKRKTLADLE